MIPGTVNGLFGAPANRPACCYEPVSARRTAALVTAPKPTDELGDQTFTREASTPMPGVLDATASPKLGARGSLCEACSKVRYPIPICAHRAPTSRSNFISRAGTEDFCHGGHIMVASALPSTAQPAPASSPTRLRRRWLFARRPARASGAVAAAAASSNRSTSVVAVEQTEPSHEGQETMAAGTDTGSDSSAAEAVSFASDIAADLDTSSPAVVLVAERDVVRQLRDEDEAVKVRAVAKLAELIDHAVGEEAMRLASYLRGAGCLAPLLALLENHRTQQDALRILGNLASSAVDAQAAETKRLLDELGAFERILPLIYAQSVTTVVYALGSVQNLCAKREYALHMRRTHADARLRELINGGAGGQAGEGRGAGACCASSRSAAACTSPPV